MPNCNNDITGSKGLDVGAASALGSGSTYKLAKRKASVKKNSEKMVNHFSRNCNGGFNCEFMALGGSKMPSHKC